MDFAPFDDRDRLAVTTLRCLAIDMVEAAKSGHPGAPLGQASLAYALWSRFLRFDPADPAWPNRDRFVLSCGHASALHYALLYLAGYDLPLGELRRFRQMGSRTPGHPERGVTPGVEMTTGPLGQGLSSAVGMAMATRLLAAHFNRPGFSLFDHRIWVLASDGDLMEGVASEACSLAGHHRLGALTVLYDANRITIEGSTDLAFSENVAARFAAYGWRTLEVEDGNDLAAIGVALAAATSESERPTLVTVRTTIGFGSPHRQNTAEVHGSPLGPEEAALTKAALGAPGATPFHAPEAAFAAFAPARLHGAVARAAWQQLRERYRDYFPGEAAELERRLTGTLPAGWDAELPEFSPGSSIATRAASGQALNALAPRLPELVGGSADLAPSNNTLLQNGGDFSPSCPDGRNFHFGVREHAMGAIANGLALSGLLRPFAATFLIFSDYLRPAIRLAALMELPVIYVFTHDSIFVGEDGPTHQPVDQLASLRAIPGLVVLRPADGPETVAAWRFAIARHDGPTALVLSRQKLPTLARCGAPAMTGLAQGGYVVWESGPDPEVVLIASGSEVATAVGAAELLATRGRLARVVSLPSWELFAATSSEVQAAALGPGVPRLAVEAGAGLGWHRWVGERGAIVAVDRFGASAPYEELATAFHLTPAAVADRAEALLQAGRGQE